MCVSAWLACRAQPPVRDALLRSRSWAHGSLLGHDQHDSLLGHDQHGSLLGHDQHGSLLGHDQHDSLLGHDQHDSLLGHHRGRQLAGVSSHDHALRPAREGHQHGRFSGLRRHRQCMHACMRACMPACLLGYRGNRGPLEKRC